MSAHSPGPWTVDPVSPTWVEETSGGRMNVADCDVGRGRRTDEQRVANARLISAAPEMKTALEECLDLLECVTRESDQPRIEQAVYAARAALAKAGGK